MATKHANAASYRVLQPLNYMKHYIAIDDKRSNAMLRGKNTMMNAYDRSELIREYRLKPDPFLTEAKFYSEVAKMVDKAAAATLAEFGAAETAMAQAIADAQQRLKVASGIKPTEYSRAIQDRLAAMPEAKRAEVVSAAFANHDLEILGAIVDVPEVVSGVKPDLISGRLEGFIREVAPVEFADLAAHREAAEWLRKGANNFMRWTVEARHGTQDAAEKRAQVEAILASFGEKLETSVTDGNGFSGQPDQD